MYNVSISIYYLYVIKYNMRERVFKRTIEPWLHAVPTLWNVFAASFVVASRNMNPAMTGGCWIALNAHDCDENDPQDCIQKGKMVLWLNIIVSAAPLGLCVFANIGILIYLWMTVRQQEIRMDRYRMRRVSFSMRSSLNSINTPAPGNGTGGVLATAFALRSAPRTRSRSRDFLQQAGLYTSVFLLAHIFSIVGEFYLVLRPAHATHYYTTINNSRLLTRTCTCSHPCRCRSSKQNSKWN